MQSRRRVPGHFLFLGGLLAAASVAGCSVDDKGLAVGAGDASVPSTSGSGGRVGSGGGMAIGTGGAGLVGGGTGGMANPGSGGQSGDQVGSGGSVGTGGKVGVGTGGLGTTGTGGANDGTGGVDGGGGPGGRGGAAGRGDAGGQGGVTTTPACNATNCANGCCMGAACMTNRNNQRCGTAGAACAPCAACYQCSNMGVCGLTPTALWDVICSSATITPNMPQNANGAWDTGVNGANALPDPFCQFTRNGAAQTRTTTLMNTLTPMWNQSIAPTNVNVTHNFLVNQTWEVTVIDDDGGVTADDPICSVAPQLTAADFAAGTVALPPTQSCTGLTIRLVCAE